MSDVKSDSMSDARSSANVDIINKISPLSVKIRDDWYQSNEEVIITIYAKNVKEDKLDIQFEENSVSISFPGVNGSEYNYNLEPLYAEIDVAESRYKLYSTKLEITLKRRLQVSGHHWKRNKAPLPKRIKLTQLHTPLVRKRRSIGIALKLMMIKMGSKKISFKHCLKIWMKILDVQ